MTTQRSVDKKRQLFDHIVANLLYLFRRTTQDIQAAVAVAFLCTGVKNPDDYDYRKLLRVIQHIRNITLTIEPNNNPQWWVDSSYVVHLYMKSLMGIFMSIGKGGTYTSS